MEKLNKPTHYTSGGIAIWRVGTGAPLLVIAGGPAASSQLYRKYLAALAQRRQLIFFDYRGTGNSRDPGVYGFDEDQADLISVIKTMKLQQFSILAHSYGGLHAIKFAAENPDRIQKLILVISCSDDIIVRSRFTRQLARALPNASHLAFQGCGHWAFWEKHPQFLTAVTLWLK